MNNIVSFEDYKLSNKSKSSKNLNLTSDEVITIEKIRDGIENLLNTASAVNRDPLAIVLAAGRYASMRLYQIQGRAETMAFFDNCIQTVEIAEDISKNKK